MSRFVWETVVIGILLLILAVAAALYFDATHRSEVIGSRVPRPDPPDPPQVVKPADPAQPANELDDREHTLSHEGQPRRYLVHVPQPAKKGEALPVVLAFHGGMGKAETQRTQSRLNDVADENGFLVVYPDGTGLTRLLTFNAGKCCGYASGENVDDVGFIRKLLDELPKHYPIDDRRIYATGLSNGAMLCYRLACEMPERLAAIAPVAGSLTVDGPPPQRPMPICIFHGAKDQNVPLRGGRGERAYDPIAHRSLADTVALWVKWNHCQPQPVERLEQKDFVRIRYAPAAGQPGAPILVYELPEGGHTWPGGVDVSAHLNTGKMITTVDASRLIWEFFRQFQLP